MRATSGEAIMNPLRWTFRSQCLLASAVCAALLAIAIYLQLHGGLVPCPLCIFQRIAFTAAGVVFLIAGLHAPRSAVAQRIYGLLALVATCIGAGIAGRHVWIQHLPADEVPTCGPGLDYMRELMPLTSVIRKVLTGSGECARVDWTLFGLSMAEWGLVWFLLLAGWAAWLLLRRTR
jgi:disulfide bond formation protein DsbB